MSFSEANTDNVFMGRLTLETNVVVHITLVTAISAYIGTLCRIVVHHCPLLRIPK